MQRREVIRALVLGTGGLAIGGSRVAAAGTEAAGAAGARRVVARKIELTPSRVIMQLLIDGQGPYPFMLDTGGFLSLIDDDLARALKLQMRGSTGGSGVGGSTVMPLYLANEVVFGGAARQRGVAFAGLSHGFSGGVRGALAAGFLTAIDSDLDFDTGEWRSYPDGRPERTGYVRIGSAMDDSRSGRAGSRHLYGDATVNGRSFRFLLDTGAPGGVSVDQAAAKALGLLDAMRPYAPMKLSGIGGQTGIARLVRADSVTFGDHRLDRPLVMIRAAGDNRGTGVSGIIGLNTLRQFNLSTDVRAKALWVRWRGADSALPERYGMSGLWIERDGAGVEIAAVGTGSPAADAGLRVGDRILDDAFETVLRKIGGRPGAQVSLRIDRAGAAQTVTFALKPYL